MSINRTCQNCFQEEKIRVNFGNNIEAERDFHTQKWCSCGYNSPSEMMADQDMGFTDPKWIPIAMYFIENYHLRISQGHIHNSEELVRFFLKLLKSSANNIRKSIEIDDRKQNEEYEFIYEGKAKQKPRTNIFKDTFFPNINFENQQSKQGYQTNHQKPKSSKIVLYMVVGIFIGLVVGILL